MKVGVIGSGYVGLVTGVCFSHLGHQVICVDNNLEKIELLKKGKSPIYEPGLDQMITESLRKKKISFTSSIRDAVTNSEILFICVNTPPRDNGEADLSYVENVCRDIAKNLKKYRLIVEKSTVPVETGQWIQKTMQSVVGDKTLFDVASNPEFLREGSAIHDLLNPDRVVIGVSSSRAEKLLRELYKPFVSKLLVTDIKSAEIIKHASNSFLATKISFINAVSRICDAAGADVENVARGMGLDPRIGASFLKAGIGFGGFCFPKDLSAFLRMSEKLGAPFNLLEEVLKINDTQKEYFIRKIESRLWNLKSKTLAVLGIAFKANTDDIRYAPSLDIIQKLQAQGVKIQAYDPQAMRHAKKLLKHVTFCKNPYGAAKNADALVLLTEWKEFLDLDYSKIKKLLNDPIIFDGRNALDPSKMRRLGFEYISIGRS